MTMANEFRVYVYVCVGYFIIFKLFGHCENEVKKGEKKDTQKVSDTICYLETNSSLYPETSNGNVEI